MRLSTVLLLLSLAGIMGGAALISLGALGAAIVADSVAVGAYALLRESGGRREAAPVVEDVSLPAILERARRRAS